MLTSAKIGKQNGDTRTRKPELGYLNLSSISRVTRGHGALKQYGARELLIVISYRIFIDLTKAQIF
jgi:hypothetical protein